MEKKNYQFTQVPTNLFILLDNNCRSMLFTLIQLSSYYADDEGWFFRRWEDLIVESNLSLNLSMATVQTLFNHHIIEAKPTGYGKGRKPNYYKVNFDNFAKYDEISIEDVMKNPDLKIHTVEYKGSNFKLNLVREVVNNVVKDTVNNVVKSENNIYNIENVYNTENIENVKNERMYKKECIYKEDFGKKEFKIECNNENLTTMEGLIQYINDTLTGETEEDLINQKGIILGNFNHNKIPMGNLFYRASSYLNRIYQEKLELVQAESK